jgi:hypothetical protein
VQAELQARRRKAAQKVGIEIAQQQHRLEEDQRRVPDIGRAAEQRQRHLREQRLDQEQEPGAEEDGRRKKGDGLEPACPGRGKGSGHRTARASALRGVRSNDRS